MRTPFNESSKAILSSVFRNQPVSRTVISELTGFSKATVSNAVDELIKIGLVEETGNGLASPNGGPRPIYLSINAGYASVITIIVRRFLPVVQVDDLMGETVREYPTGKSAYDDIDELCEDLAVCCERAVADFGADRILGIGMSIAGNVEDNRIINSPIPRLTQLDLAEMFSSRLGLDTFLERDVYSMAYGEKWKGVGKTYDDFTAIWASTGIGSATLIGSNLVRGANGMAGEIGFMTAGSQEIDLQPRTLNDFGPFESVASIHNLELKYSDTFEHLVESRSEDPAFREDLNALCDKMAMGITNIIVLLNPGAIVINGRLRCAQKLIQEHIEQRLKVMCPVSCRVEYSFLGQKAITLGGTYLVLNQKLGITL